MVLEEQEPVARILKQGTDESAGIVSGVESLLREAAEELEAQKEALPAEILETVEPAAEVPEDVVEEEVVEAAEEDKSD